MKTAQEMRELASLRRAERMDKFQRKTEELVHGAIAKQIKLEAEQGSDCVKYYVSADYCIDLVIEELEHFGYLVTQKGRELIIFW